MSTPARPLIATALAAGLVATGLGAGSPAVAVVPDHPVINEFSASTTGTDVEYLELLAPPGTDLSALRVLEIEGDSGPSVGVVDGVFAFPAPDADGRSLLDLAANELENGTLSLLLVTGDIPSGSTDIDADDDGTIDDTVGFTVIDAVAVDDGGTGDLAYGGVVLSSASDGLPFAPGGASRIPDGTDTDSTSDWVRNDFNLAGIGDNDGSTLELGEAVNTPGAANTTEYVSDPGGGGGDPASCTAETVTIGSVQGVGDTGSAVGETVTIRGTVVGDFQDGLDGFYVQDAGDGDPATSDGVFVFEPAADVAEGDVVTVTGQVTEFFGLTDVAADAVAVCDLDLPAPAATELVLPLTEDQHEAVEGMLVTLPQDLAILEYFNFGRFGQVVVGTERQFQPTAVHEPGSPEADALLAENLAERITIDDGRSSQNPDPAIHPNGDEFTLENTFRGGDLVTDATGILDYRFSTWAIQPTQGAQFTVANPGPEVPEVGGDVTVASFNVLNYFTTIDPTPTNSGDDDYTRGADTAEELERQQAKIVAALAEIDADVFGLVEIENSGVPGFEDSTAAPNEAVATLTAALNAAVGDGVYDYIPTGVVGGDAITTALVYKPATVSPVGDFALLTEAVDPRWLDEKNRPALAQTFATADGGEVTVVVNHLKSKGSACTDVDDPTDPDGQGNCNGVRTDAALAMADWLAGDPTGQGAGRELIIGDLNSYDKEDPIVALQDAGYTDLLAQFEGEYAYSYVFDGQLGYLDYAMAGGELAGDVTGAAAWRINADEPNLIDYDMSFKQDAQDALFAPDPYRSSDHDPVIVGLDLTPADTTPPEITVPDEPIGVFPPNGKLTTVTVDVSVTDDSAVTLEVSGVTAEGQKRAAIDVIDETTFEVVAVNGAVYTISYLATDAAGNTSTAEVVITVGPKGARAVS